MRLFLVDTPATVAARLARQNLPAHCVSTASPGMLSAAQALPGPKLWLVAGPHKPVLGHEDVLLDADTTPTQPGPSNLGLAWQDSPFAVEYGFLLAVGGDAALIARAKPVLDALSPSPGAWLHAGGANAPHFLATVARELGSGLGGLAAFMLTVPSMGFNPILQGQQALLERLALQAENYLASSDDETYLPSQPLPPLFGLTPPNGCEQDSPARKLAALLLWLKRQAG